MSAPPLLPLALAVALGLALARPAAAQEPALEGAAATHLEQARLFHRRGWTDDAWEELQRALATPTGARSHAAHALAAAWAAERRDLPVARHHASRAVVLAPSSEARAQAAAVALDLEEGYGLVRIEGPRDGVRVPLEVRRARPPLDPAQRAWLADVSARLAAPGLLPVEVGLPVGPTMINGVAVEVVAGVPATVSLRRSQVTADRPLRVLTARLGVASGVSLWTGPDSAGLGPSWTTRIDALLPLGPVEVGPAFTLDRPTWTTPEGRVQHSPLAPAAGGRVAWSLAAARPLWLEVAADLRWGRVPGLALGCAGEAPLRCGLGQPDADDALRATWTGLRPGLEGALGYREAGRDRGLLGALRVGWERPVGRLSAAQPATLPDGGTIPWAVEGRGLRLHGFRFLAELALTL